MQIALFIYYTPSWQRLANLVLPVAAAYCEKHGYAKEFVCEDVENTVDIKMTSFEEITRHNLAQDRVQPVGYYKMLKLRELMCKYSHGSLIWVLDLDTLITNTDISLGHALKGPFDLYISEDIHGLNAGSFVIECNKRTKSFINVVISNFDAPEEQTVMLRNIGMLNVSVLRTPSINSIPYAHYQHDWQRLIGNHDMPTHEQGNWQPGDLLMHLPGLDMNTRINIIMQQLKPKTGLIISTYNRPGYLKECLESLKRCNLDGVTVLIVDDCSTDKETKRLITDAVIEFNCTASHKDNRLGICDSLLLGYNRLFGMGCTFVMNLDSDAIVRNDFIERMQELHLNFPDEIITGFHCTTKNADGSERHAMVRGGEGWNKKKSVGGINMGMSKAAYEKHVKPALEECLAHGGNWDHKASLSAGGVISIQPSIVQHIGIDSAMGHREAPDVADSFKPLVLHDVTLVIVDDDERRAATAIAKCCESVIFGDKVFISSYKGSFAGIRRGHIEPLGSKENYSSYVIRHLHEHIKTKYALIVQHDGYITNVKGWRDEYLQYDYIGAPWWYTDGNNVGNGGFSLRSTKLMRLTEQLYGQLPGNELHPEDDFICRQKRAELESHGINFAPPELAAQFSYEGWNQPAKYYNGQFGVHGQHAINQAENWKRGISNAPVKKRLEGIIFNQFLGLGDILFLVPLCREYKRRGHDVVWPVADEYHGDLKRHFPDIQFVLKSGFKMNYDNRRVHYHNYGYGPYKVLPFRWNMCSDPLHQDAMTSKYTMVGEDWRMWQELVWQRDISKERELLHSFGFDNTGAYELYACDYGCQVTGGKKTRHIHGDDRPYINLKSVAGYSLLDWAGIMQQASVIHAVSSSTLYMFETLPLKAKEIHLYGRDNGMRDFDFIRPLLTKNYIFHP